MTNKTRRDFMKTSSILAASTVTASSLTAPALASPVVHTARRTNPTRPEDVITGQGDYRFSVNHQFAQLPEKYRWQTTHNVCVDSANNLYVIHEGKANLKDHPSIFVFSPEGKFIRAFGSEFQGGGHGIDIRKEGSQEFLYVAAYQGVKSFAKMTLTGQIVWYQKAPMESKRYAAGEDTSVKANWTRKGFLPTNFAFLDDGGFLLADGYGAHCIHKFDKDGKWQAVFGGSGAGEGKFNLCHGLTVDRREGREPSIVVTDRSHNTLQYLNMDGEYIETLTGYGKPANVETRGNLLLVPELVSRVTLLDDKNNVVARLGEAIDRLGKIKDLRRKPKEWQDGQFVHPHDACFDQGDNLFVAEWVEPGRVTKLTKLD